MNVNQVLVKIGKYPHITRTSWSGFDGCYWPDEDTIEIAPRTIPTIVILLHEMIHWTGHRKRLNRPIIRSLNTYQRSNWKNKQIEEAIAIYGQTMLSRKLGVGLKSAKYWKRLLMAYLTTLSAEDKRMAYNKARQAVRFLLS